MSEKTQRYHQKKSHKPKDRKEGWKSELSKISKNVIKIRNASEIFQNTSDMTNKTKKCKKKSKARKNAAKQKNIKNIS